jgi:zinc transport system permease protein
VILGYAFFRNALAISLSIAVLCPCIGIFLVLRRYAMIGDALSHASLAGVTVGLLVDINPILGAFAFTAFCGVLIEFLRGYFRKYTELILSIVLALGVGVAITIISSGKLHANANSFLFGSVLTVSREDVWTVFGLSLSAVAALIILYDRLVYIAYDEDAAKIAGVKVGAINYAFSVLVAAAIAASIRIVGVMVIGSMIALPVATAIQLGRGFRLTLLWSVLFSVIDIMAGLFLSYFVNVAPGGFTAVVSVAVLLLVIMGKAVARRLSRHGLAAS